MDAYVNILDHALVEPSIAEDLAPNSTLDSLLTKLTGVNWFKLYSISGAASATNNDHFLEQFDEIFYHDELVKKHVESIVDAEITSRILNPEFVGERRSQLYAWLHDFYLNQLESISNTTTSTITDHYLVLKACYILFTNILSKIFKDGIWIHKATFLKFKLKLTRSVNDILLLPNHKSHIDYIILHYLFVRFNIETPVVIAGENLNVPIFGKGLKKLGAFFIKRKFSNVQDFYHLKNNENLIKLKMKERTSIELFIEGTRSRNGKLMHPKTGFLSILLKSIRENYDDDVIDDTEVTVQPISLIYEKPYEFDEYLIELNGLDKKQESFSSILSSGLKFFFTRNSPGSSNMGLENYGKLIIKFHDDALRLKTSDVNTYGSTFRLTETVLEMIHEVSYVTSISVLCLSIIILLYQNLESNNTVYKSEVVKVFKFLVIKLQERDSLKDNHEITDLVRLPEDEIILEFDSLLVKFILSSDSVKEENQLVINDSSYVINNEISLTYFKNGLLNNFIVEIFLSRLNVNKAPMWLYDRGLGILKSIFKFEFLTSLVNEDSIKSYMEAEETHNDMFSKLLDPFLESYELAAMNLQRIVSISMKEWFHLLYSSNRIKKTRFQESLNKSNLMYAIYVFQDLKLLRVENGNQVIILDDNGLELMRQYLHSVRTRSSEIETLQESVYERFFTSSRL